MIIPNIAKFKQEISLRYINFYDNWMEYLRYTKSELLSKTSSWINYISMFAKTLNHLVSILSTLFTNF